MNRFYAIKLLSGSNTIELFVNSGLATDYQISLPSSAPTDGQLLSSDGSGNLSWITPTAGGGNGTPSATYTLNNDTTTGVPSENGTLAIARGDESTAIVRWVESLDKWVIGTEASSKPISRTHTQTFTSADVSSGLVTITHNLGVKPVVAVLNNSNESIGLDTNHTSVNDFTVDVSRVGTLTGTWTAIAIS